jgi:hypothetical protein
MSLDSGVGTGVGTCGKDDSTAKNAKPAVAGFVASYSLPA